MNGVCLVIDRLHVGQLGAYGNTWIETPAVDRLASQAFLFDQALIDTPRLEILYRSYWQGWHAVAGRQPLEVRPTLASLLGGVGVNTALLTDEPAVAQHELATEFDELIRIDPPWEPRRAERIEQTHLARCFAEAIDWLRSAPAPFLLWCHLAGLDTTWDAPEEFRQAYWEPGDPQPPRSAQVPDLVLRQGHDPDELLGFVQAYAGEVSSLDACLGALMELLQEDPAGKETLVVLTSSRGFPLGEHRRVGACDEALYAELVHVPLMLRFPDEGAAARSQALVEPADLWATLLDWWGVSGAPQTPSARSLVPIVRQEVRAVHDRLCIAGRQRERAIRTPPWYLRLAAEIELFAKPDDRWEVNDVSDRCREVAERLQDNLSQYEQLLRFGQIADLPPLDDTLLSGLE